MEHIIMIIVYVFKRIVDWRLTNPLQCAHVHGRNEFVSWKSCFVSCGEHGCSWTLSTELNEQGERCSSFNNSCFGGPKTASTMSFMRSSRVFLRSGYGEPSDSCSLLVELNLNACRSAFVLVAINGGWGKGKDEDLTATSCCDNVTFNAWLHL